jgi:peptidoglycan/LPS O-acetylase OafA/YrhL
VTVEAGRLRTVDALRAIAALAIVAYHVAFVLGELGGQGAGAWLAQLQVGVPLFFAISGFLLYRPWVAAKLAGGPPPSTGVYALRRVLRIVPAYWVALLLIAVAMGRDEVFAWPGGLVYPLFAQAYDVDSFTGGIGQAWTLTVEVAFYAALPLLALLARRLPGLRGELLLLGAMVALSIAWRAGVLALLDPSDGPYIPLLTSLPAELDLFAAGMGLAVLSVSAGESRAARVPAWCAWAAAGAAFATLALWTPGQVGAVLAGHELQLVVAAGLLAPAVIGVAHGGRLRHALASPALAWVGLVSYGIYLWHLDVLRALGDAGAPGVVVALAGPVIAIAFGAASWYLVERHAITLGHRLRLRRAAGRSGRPLAGVGERRDA